METGILHLHNFMRWAVIICGLWAIFSAYNGKKSGAVFSPAFKRPALFFMISCDIQLVLGLLLYSLRGWMDKLNAGGIMSDNYNRFFAVEHSLMMLIALIFVHLGFAQTKRNIADGKRFKNMFTFFLIAFILILAMIPWPFREGIGRPWF